MSKKSSPVLDPLEEVELSPTESAADARRTAASPASLRAELVELRRQLREAYERAQELAAENARLNAVASERAGELEFLRPRLVQAERAAEEERLVALRTTKALERAQQQLAASPAQQLAELVSRIAALRKAGSAADPGWEAAEEHFGIQRRDLLWFGGWTQEGATWVASRSEASVFTDLEAARAECAQLKRRGDTAHVLWLEL